MMDVQEDSSLSSSSDDDDEQGHRDKRARIDDDERQTTDPTLLSVEELDRLLLDHEQKRTLFPLLTMVSVDSETFQRKHTRYFNGFYYAEHVDRGFGTPLHFACLDKNGNRGQEKIKRILQSAKRAYIDVRQMLTVKMKWAREIDEEGEELQPISKNPDWNKKEPYSLEPLQCLIENKCATVESVQLICDAWPSVVHRGDGIWLGDSILERMVNSSARNLPIVKVLLCAASKTKEGARPLVLSNTKELELAEIDSDGGDGHDAFAFSGTPLHMATHHCGEPQGLIAALIAACPDALEHCTSGGCCSRASAPLHNVARLKNFSGEYVPPFTDSYDASVQSILALFRYSTVKAITFALLYFETQIQCTRPLKEESGYMVLKETIEYCLSQSETFEPHLNENIKEILRLMTKRSDEDGNTVLHHAAAFDIDLTPQRVWHHRQSIIDQRDFDTPLGDAIYDLDLDQKERKLLEERIAEDKQKNQDTLIGLFKWIAQIDGDSVEVQNNNGQTPMDILFSRGTLDVIYELIRFSPHSTLLNKLKK